MGCDYIIYYDYKISYIDNDDNDKIKFGNGFFTVGLYSTAFDIETEKEEKDFYKKKYLYNGILIENNKYNTDNKTIINRCSIHLKENYNPKVIISLEINSEFDEN